jgi:hypothetical protein
MRDRRRGCPSRRSRHGRPRGIRVRIVVVMNRIKPGTWQSCLAF